MNFKTKLFERINALNLNGFNEKQLFVRLSVHSGFEKTEIKDALRELIKDGVLILGGDSKYYTPEAIGAVKGVLQGNKRGFAFFIPDGGGGDVFVPHSNLKGALHKDRVFVKVKVEKDGKNRREGEVLSILERGMKKVIGTFKKEENCAFVIPDDKDYFNDVFIPANKFRGAQDGYKVVARITDFDSGKNPEGEVAEILGKAGKPLTEVLAITRTFGFSDGFDKSVKQQAELISALPLSSDGRNDLRGLLTVTIDGDDAKDLDDAVSLTRCGEDYKLFVHIADVSHYVKHKSVLDDEAFKRGTSLYFPGNVIPMLPQELSNGICSLNEKTDRLTLSVEMLIDKSGVVKGHKISESVINSHARMTYKNVAKILGGDPELSEKYKEITPMLKSMHELSLILNKRRVNRGSIFFESKESVIVTDDKGRVTDIKPYEYSDANSLIEEFMLITNETVAEYINHMEYPFVYRVHETPSNEKMEVFKQFMTGIGFKIKLKEEVKPHEIQKYLLLAEETEYRGIVNKIMLRSMQKARYDIVNRGHFGLAAQYYCHFTSPIRRYPDLVVHRIIKMMLNGELGGASIKKMTAFCAEAAVNSSEREKAAESAERQCEDYYKAYFMEDKTGKEYDGVISSVTAFGIFVELPNTVEGLIRTEWLPPDDYLYDERKYKICGKKHGYSLGDKIKIRVESADRLIRQVNFSPVIE
ncbi:MAG: ribonuclease R [Clostridiales bacterium]|jgi:ribonuclease R|nr:ribonuclease R [Clostridiales bacterium]